MTFRNEVLEGIAAYKALKPTGQDDYYEQKAQMAKHENDDYNEQQKVKQQYIDDAAARKQSGLIPTQSRSDAIGSAPATPGVAMPGYTDQAGNPVYNTAPGMARGGRVRRFAGGGLAPIGNDPDPAPSGISNDIAAGIKATLRAPIVYRALATNARPDPKDAGLRGSNAIAEDAARRYGAVPASDGSADGATGSGGDSTGGVSGTGGVGGSASDDAGGSAAAGVGGDDGGTYRRGGRVRRKAFSTNFAGGGQVDRSVPAGDGPRNDPDYDKPKRGPSPGLADYGRANPGPAPRGVPRDDYQRDDPPERDPEPYPDYDEDPPMRGRYGLAQGGRVDRFADGGMAGGDPNNEADRIIHEIISADVGDPREANDPSIELRERGERDRAAMLTLPPSSPDDLPDVPQPPSAAAQRGAARKRGQLPTPQRPATPPKDQDPATRTALATAFQSEQPEPDDAFLSTGNAQQPPGKISPMRGPPGEPPDPEERAPAPEAGGPEDIPPAPQTNRAGFPVNARPAEEQLPEPDAKYPTTPPGGLSVPKSRMQEVMEKYVPFVGPEETGTEEAADQRWFKDIQRRKDAARVSPSEAITPEAREKREAELAAVVAEEKQGPPSERLRARRRAIETGTPASAFADKDPEPVGPIRAAVQDATAGIPVPSAAELRALAESRRNKRLGIDTSTTPYGPPAPTVDQQAAQAARPPTAPAPGQPAVPVSDGVEPAQPLRAAPGAAPPPPPGRLAQPDRPMVRWCTTTPRSGRPRATSPSGR